MNKAITLAELNTIAKEVLVKAHNIKNDSATVIAMHGDLGSGKTTLTQEIGKILGIKEKLVSPTFVIMKKYKIADTKWQYLIHIDAYRLEKSRELENLGWAELLADKNNLIIIEWPEQVPDCIPKHACHIHLTHIKEGKRQIKF